MHIAGVSLSGRKAKVYITLGIMLTLNITYIILAKLIWLDNLTHQFGFTATELRFFFPFLLLGLLSIYYRIIVRFGLMFINLTDEEANIVFDTPNWVPPVTSDAIIDAIKSGKVSPLSILLADDLNSDHGSTSSSASSGSNSSSSGHKTDHPHNASNRPVKSFSLFSRNYHYNNNNIRIINSMAFSKTTLCAGICAAAFAGVGAYYTYQSYQETHAALIVQQAALAAQQNKNLLTERGLDQVDVAAGRMTPENYNKKWQS